MKKELDKEYVAGLSGLDAQTRDIFMENHMLCESAIEDTASGIQKVNVLTSLQLPDRMRVNGSGHKGSILASCDLKTALFNQLGYTPSSCIVTKVNMLNCSFKSDSDPTRKLHFGMADGASTGMFMNAKVEGFEDDEAEVLDKNHLITLNHGSNLNNIGVIYDQTSFLESPVFTRYRDALRRDPSATRSDTQGPVASANYSQYVSPTFRRINDAVKGASHNKGVMSVELENGETVLSKGDFWMDLLSKNLPALSAPPVASYMPAGGHPDCVQIQMGVADCDHVMKTVQDRIIFPLQEHTINLEKGNTLTFKFTSTKGKIETGGKEKTTDWPASCTCLMTLQVEVAIDATAGDQKKK